MSDSVLLDRRAVVKLAAATLAFEMGSSFIILQGSAHAEEEPASDVGQVGFLVKPSYCLNCQACVDACRKYNRIPFEEPSRRKIVKYQKDGQDPVFVSTSCMHCKEPACVKVCPAGAIQKGNAGIVKVDSDLCIGCKYCYQACPFGIPSYNDVSMDKCDCCLGNGIEPGETPHCVEACKYGALHFGLVDDLLAECPDAVVIDAPTEPSMYLA
ncbi:4Fe-4S dicluster domain-containing protein [Slackia heliotrinireducens]|uniref:4Fe-4S dicluster domain-containing protein n=1 Tax=Slackia heliotrinireducens TaxID=84110 RepID=UPI00331539D7